LTERIFEIDTGELRERLTELRAGDRVLLSGTVYTARDAAHLEIFRILDTGGCPPFEIRDAVIYYAGPTPGKNGMAVGSCGPTTSARMDRFSPRLLDLGLAGMIGKGERAREVVEAIVRNRAVYLCAVGGAGALMAKHIDAAEEIAFPELGCESVKRLTVRALPLTVGVDSRGGDLFTQGRAAYRSAR
jgi:fumarate hydratase subunit beta